MPSQEDLRLGNFLLSEKMLDKTQLQRLFHFQSEKEKGGEKIFFVSLLEDLDLLNEEEMNRLKAKCILIECAYCYDKRQILGPHLPSHLRCTCGGTFRIINEGLEDSIAPETKQLNLPNKEEKVGAKIFGKCKLLRKIGEGGMGAVYFGEHLTLQTPVAIKLLPSNLVNAERVKRFFLEARALALIDHRNVVRFYDVGEEKDFFYISMQFIDGDTLEERIKREQRIPWRAATQLVRDIALGLQAVHEQNIVHRDIKPQNIMITKKGVIKITDFGLARATEQDASLTQSNQMLGTPYYMSPEQCATKKADFRADIYSLGITYYYMLTGAKPIDAPATMMVIMKHLYEKPEPLHKYCPEIPIEVERLIGKMLEKKPEDRHSSTQSLVDELEKLIALPPQTPASKRVKLEPHSQNREGSSISSITKKNNLIQIKYALDRAIRKKEALENIEKIHILLKEAYFKKINEALLQKEINETALLCSSLLEEFPQQSFPEVTQFLRWSQTPKEEQKKLMQEFDPQSFLEDQVFSSFIQLLKSKTLDK